jgi:diguanylate cyclase (GGDEF)-like protein
VGDKALHAVAKVLKGHFRSQDMIARYGGEEFMLVLVGLSQQELMERLQNVRQTLSNKPILQEIPITLSFGVTYLASIQDMSLADLIHDVDSKLYQAKNTGRDKIIF